MERNVLVYPHKEPELDDIERQYPADRYVMIDKKLRIFTAIKIRLGSRVTTVFPHQGHEARDIQITGELSRRQT